MLNRGFEIFEFHSRLDKIQLIMHYEKLDALLLTSEFSIRSNPFGSLFLDLAIWAILFSICKGNAIMWFRDYSETKG